MKIPFSPPDITEAEIEQVAEALRSGWITTGPKTKELEREVADLCGTNRAVCLNSQTACAEMTLRLLGIHEGDEVITCAYTYTASASVVCHVGAKLVLIDTQEDSLEMDYDKLAEAITEKTKVIIPVDLGGVPCDYDRIFSIVEEKKKLFHPVNKLQEAIGRVIVMADAAHAFGATWHGKPVGSIEGWEFGAQAFVYNNEVLFVMPHGDETYMSHTAVPVGHYVPLDCDENIHEQTEEAVKNAIKALGLNNCAVNVDLILRDNKVYVIELTGRVGANCLPELVEINFGIEYYKMIAAMAVGENPLEYWNKRRETSKAGLARMILETEKEGILEEIEFNGCKDEDVLEVTFFKHQGDRVRVFENSNDCVGQVIVQGNNQKQCQDTLNEVLKNIRIKLK